MNPHSKKSKEQYCLVLPLHSVPVFQSSETPSWQGIKGTYQPPNTDLFHLTIIYIASLSTRPSFKHFANANLQSPSTSPPGVDDSICILRKNRERKFFSQATQLRQH